MIGKFDLPDWKRPMTVIGAMYRDDELYLAADSGVTEGLEGNEVIRGLYAGKLMRHPSRPLAWGITGNASLGVQDFGAKLCARDDLAADWEPLRDQIANMLADCNRKQRRLMRRAGSPTTASDLASVLLVGWVPQPVIMEFNENGRFDDYTPFGFAAIGKGKMHAITAWAALQKINGPSVPDRLNIIMTTAAQLSPGCDPPVVIWKVKPDGIEDGGAILEA